MTGIFVGLRASLIHLANLRTVIIAFNLRISLCFKFYLVIIYDSFAWNLKQNRWEISIKFVMLGTTLNNVILLHSQPLNIRICLYKT
jgi:hypothetical protein